MTRRPPDDRGPGSRGRRDNEGGTWSQRRGSRDLGVTGARGSRDVRDNEGRGKDTEGRGSGRRGDRDVTGETRDDRDVDHRDSRAPRDRGADNGRDAGDRMAGSGRGNEGRGKDTGRDARRGSEVAPHARDARDTRDARDADSYRRGSVAKGEFDHAGRADRGGDGRRDGTRDGDRRRDGDGRRGGQPQPTDARAMDGHHAGDRRDRGGAAYEDESVAKRSRTTGNMGVAGRDEPSRGGGWNEGSNPQTHAQTHGGYRGSPDADYAGRSGDNEGRGDTRQHRDGGHGGPPRGNGGSGGVSRDGRDEAEAADRANTKRRRTGTPPITRQSRPGPAAGQ